MSKIVNIGKITIGNGNRIAIQSMANVPTTDVCAVVDQISQLQNAGCDIVRVAVKTMQCAAAISDIKARIDMPIVADVHFDYKLAIAAVEIAKKCQ